MKSTYTTNTTSFLFTTILALFSTSAYTQPTTQPEPCLVDGECEVVHDANFDWNELKNGVIENKLFVNPTFSGKMSAMVLKNVVFLNGRLGDVDLSSGAILNGVVFRGNQISSLNFGGAELNNVILEGNLKHQPTYRMNEEQPAEPIPLSLHDAKVQDSIFVNNVFIVYANKNTTIQNSFFTRNNMIGSDMKGAKIYKTEFSDNDARDADLRFGNAAKVKIVKNQIHGAKYSKKRKSGVALRGNWANNPA